MPTITEPKLLCLDQTSKKGNVMRTLASIALVLLPTLAFANSDGIQVQHAWSRPMPAGAMGVVYLTVTDQGAPDTLTGVTSPVAARAELHETINDHGVMKMRAVASLPIASGEPIALAPDGYHIMLMDLKQALVAGTSFPVTLTFAKSGQITAMATVEAIGAATPGMQHGSMGGMSQGNAGNMDMHGMSMGGSGSK